MTMKKLFLMMFICLPTLSLGMNFKDKLPEDLFVAYKNIFTDILSQSKKNNHTKDLINLCTKRCTSSCSNRFKDILKKYWLCDSRGNLCEPVLYFITNYVVYNYYKNRDKHVYYLLIDGDYHYFD